MGTQLSKLFHGGGEGLAPDEVFAKERLKHNLLLLLHLFAQIHLLESHKHEITLISEAPCESQANLTVSCYQM